MSFQFLDQLAFDIAASKQVADFQHSDDRRPCVPLGCTIQAIVDGGEQVFEAQATPDPLVQRLFVHREGVNLWEQVALRSDLGALHSIDALRSVDPRLPCIEHGGLQPVPSMLRAWPSFR